MVTLQVEGIQAMGGTGAIRICANFCKKILGYDNMYTSNPTWGKNIMWQSVLYSSSEVFKYKNWSEKSNRKDVLTAVLQVHVYTFWLQLK